MCEPLKDLLDDIRGHYDRAAGELVVDVDLPDRDLVPVERAYRVDRAQRRVETMPRPADDVARLYAALAGQVALAVAAICLRTLADTVVDAVHVSVGRMGTRLVEVVVPRSRFAPMDAAWPTPQRWLREFGAVSPSSCDPATRPAG